MKPTIVLSSLYYFFILYFFFALGLVAAGIGQMVFNLVSQHVQAVYFLPYPENLLQVFWHLHEGICT